MPPADTWKNIPDLSALNRHRLEAAILGMVLGRRGLHTFPERSLWLNLVRPVVQSVSDYEESRRCCKERDGGGASFISASSFRSLERMELAIISSHRAARFCEQLAKRGALPAALSLSTVQMENLARVRHAIEHLESRVLGGVERGGPFMLLMRKLDVQIQAEKGAQSVTLTYKRLAGILHDLDRAAAHLTKTSGNYSGPLLR